MSPPYNPWNVYTFTASHLCTTPNAVAIVVAKSEQDARKVLTQEGYDEFDYHLDRFGTDKVDTEKLIGWFE